MIRRTVAVVAPHPDDESIFCGGTIARLSDGGHRVVVVSATTGDAGEGGGDLARIRARELEAAAGLLGVDAVRHLGFADSGLGPALRTGGFATVDVATAAAALADVLAAEAVDLVICDAAGGIYPHPDHRRAHEVTVVAARLNGSAVQTVTVDREHLHFVETHLVANAHDALAESAPGAPEAFGSPTVEIDCLVELDPRLLELKRRAMAAHASQLPAGSPMMALDDRDFAAVYGIEWFHRPDPARPEAARSEAASLGIADLV